MSHNTLDDACDVGLPEGYGVKLAGGRTVYRDVGCCWRERSPHTCFVVARPFEEYASPRAWEKARRFLPDDTPIVLVPLPTATDV